MPNQQLTREHYRQLLQPTEKQIDALEAAHRHFAQDQLISPEDHRLIDQYLNTAVGPLADMIAYWAKINGWDIENAELSTVPDGERQLPSVAIYVKK